MSKLRIKTTHQHREQTQKTPRDNKFKTEPTAIETSPVYTETLPFETPTATYTITQSRSIFYYYPFWQQWTISTITVLTTPWPTTTTTHYQRTTSAPTQLQPNPCRHGSHFTGAI